MPETRLMPVPDALVGERIDAALSRILGLSRSRCSDLILEGHIRVNGNPASKSLKLGENDLLEITIPDPEVPVTPVVGMDILYDDDDIVVVNKPVGVAAHSGPG